MAPSFPPPDPLPGDVDELPDTPLPDGPTDNPADRMKKDCAAKNFREALEGPGVNRNAREYISLIYRQNGRIVSTGVVTQGGSGFSQNFLEGMMSRVGITRADALGFTHNHNRNGYCPSSGSTFSEENRLNRFPSQNDLNTREWFIEGGASRVEFTMYIMSCSGDTIYSYGAGDNTNPAFSPGPEVEGENCEPEPENP